MCRALRILHQSSSQAYMHDQNGMRAIDAAVGDLADDPYPAEGFHRGRYHRLRVGRYRVLYVVDEDVITVEWVDRVAE